MDKPTTRRAVYRALLLIAAAAAVVAFALPVRTATFGSCGMAGPWVIAWGDPTGPNDPDFVYAEYNACRLAARPAVIGMLGALAVAALAAYLLLRHKRESVTSSAS